MMDGHIQYIANKYRRNPWLDQDNYVEVWLEKDSLKPDFACSSLVLASFIGGSVMCNEDKYLVGHIGHPSCSKRKTRLLITVFMW